MILRLLKQASKFIQDFDAGLKRFTLVGENLKNKNKKPKLIATRTPWTDFHQFRNKRSSRRLRLISFRNYKFCDNLFENVDFTGVKLIIAHGKDVK